MALLQLLSEERLGEECASEYFEDLYTVVSVGERVESSGRESGLVRSTYIVDWEQLVHLLESYTLFGEDIVEVKPVGADTSRSMRGSFGGSMKVARA